MKVIKYQIDNYRSLDRYIKYRIISYMTQGIERPAYYPSDEDQKLAEKVLESLLVGGYPGYLDLVAVRDTNVEKFHTRQIQELCSDEAIGRFIRSAVSFAVAIGQNNQNDARVSKTSDKDISICHNVLTDKSEGVVNIVAHKLTPRRTSGISISYTGNDNRLVKFELTEPPFSVESPPCFYDEQYSSPRKGSFYPSYNYFLPKHISPDYPDTQREFLFACRWVASGLITMSQWRERMVFPLPNS